MLAVKAYFDGTKFVPITPVNVKLNQSAIITILDDTEPVKLDKPFLKFVGMLSNDDCAEITEALLETQRIDKNEW